LIQWISFGRHLLTKPNHVAFRFMPWVGSFLDFNVEIMEMEGGEKTELPTYVGQILVCNYDLLRL
jgi:hypothetical protein